MRGTGGEGYQWVRGTGDGGTGGEGYQWVRGTGSGGYRR